MQRRFDSDDRVALLIERIVWHAAAGAALAVMILVLLGGVRWLDEVAPRPRPAVSAAPAGPVAPAVVRPRAETRTAEANPPSG